MTKETRCFIDFTDVLSLEYTCQVNGCAGRAVQPIGKQGPIYRCPVCNSEWLSHADPRIQTIQHVRDAIMDLARNHPRFKLRIEVGPEG